MASPLTSESGDHPSQDTPTPGAPFDVHESDMEDTQRPLTTLHRSVLALVLVGVYASAATLTWVLTCVANTEPKKLHSTLYGYYNSIVTLSEDNSADPGNLVNVLRSTEVYYFVKFLQSVVTALTIPVISDIRNATEGRGLLDIAHRFQPEIMNSSFGDLVARTRTKLSWTNTSDLQTRLWSHNMTLENCQDEGIKCWLQSTLMLSNMTHLDDFFWSQIYPGFGTGLVKQFVPQVNWTVKALYSSDTNFPQTCAGTGNTNKLPLRYSLQGPEGSLNLEFCMPGNSPKTTWRAQRHRQHLHEELFVRLDLAEDPSGLSPAVGKYMYQVILDTTAGYFELPNFMNGGFVSTLLNADPVKICSYAWDCLFQHSNSWNSTHQIPPNTTRMNDTSTIENRGPLLTIALALFGPGSFLNASDVQRQYDPDGREQQCGLRLPMAGLLQSLDSGSSPLDKIDLCYKANDAALQTAQAQFVTALFPDPIDGLTAAQKTLRMLSTWQRSWPMMLS
ncbi:hypothetical protein ACCO45_004766 [Purpureocillium lilacinum]|uniref:Uncharacterized protein n=1 Tax=Purpureocillium lilacinum TaxID=33203 RepID=A0ACC4DUU0_PURLI